MIKVLPKDVANKIAAGEVIESPVSIVKELIENSIDAGATSITCEIIKGGKEEIRVTDNGSGIPKDQVSLAFLRHATSKIRKAEDLKSLSTLGFRGEALTSIAAISRTELITKTNDESVGSKIVIHGGNTISEEGIGCPVGTTIIVKDIFYNVPARAKFMKSEAAEAGKVIDMMSRLAITRPDIRFTLISNGKNYFTTLGNGDLKDAIISVYKDREYKELIQVSYPINKSKDVQHDTSSIRIHGYISRPSFARTSRRSQYVFVNGRSVKNNTIDKGIDLGYKERLFEGRYPIVFLFLEIDSSKVDVNVHPNKKEVRFNDEVAVMTAVSESIRYSIGLENAVIHGTDTFVPEKKDNTKDNNNETRRISEEQVDIKQFLSSKERPSSAKESSAKEIYDVLSENGEHFSDRLESYNSINEKLNHDSNNIDFHTNKILDKIPNNVEFGSPDINESQYKPFDFDELRFGEIIFGTYITATDQDSFYLFDQHACHERVNYERFVGLYLSGNKESQVILTPFTFDVPVEMTTEEEEWCDILNRMGYNIDMFGDNTFIVREIPVFMTLSEGEDFIREFVDNYYNDRRTENRIVIDKLITKSCKSSIKANDHISSYEVEALIGDLKACRNPFSCPHGRPTFIKFSKYEIEKMFKRIV